MSDGVIITALICATVLIMCHMSLTRDGGDEDDG